MSCPEANAVRSGSPRGANVDLTGRTLLGKYEIESLIGQGGMGAVWRARHALTGRKLAIKALDESYAENPSVVRRFGREARAASACQHPGIVEVLDLDRTEDDVPFLVMEFLEGENLARKIERRGRLTEEEVVDLGTQLLEALEAAHGHGIIHRDLKPENIYIVPAGQRGEAVKILDFGISHMSDEEAAKLTMTGSVLGTPHYMSPEQAMGETEVDHRADLYAVGVVLYECAVGDVPFDAPNYNKLLRTILDEPPVPPRRRGAQISPALERVILWAMEKDRERRVGSARAMIEWLAKAAGGEAPAYQPPASWASGAPWASASSSGGFPAVDAAYTPAGALPPRPSGLTPTIGDGAMTSSSASWRIPDGPEGDLGSGERELWPASNSPPLDLHLDEAALRPPVGLPPPPSMPSAPLASTSEEPSSASTAPAALRAHFIPPRDVSEPTGRYPRPPSERAYESEPSPPPPWRRYALWGAASVAAFVLVVASVRWAVEPGVEEPPLEMTRAVPAKVEAAPRVPAWVRVVVEGLPPEARLRLDGLPASSPLRLPRGGTHVLEIAAPGYVDRRIELEADRNRTVRADLRPALGTVQEGP